VLGFGYGALPAAFGAAVLACETCGKTAPVSAGLPEFGEDHGDSAVAPGPAVPAALIAPAISRTPPRCSEPAGTDFRFQVAQNASTASCA
jgi:hypothetical protein